MAPRSMHRRSRLAVLLAGAAACTLIFSQGEDIAVVLAAGSTGAPKIDFSDFVTKVVGAAAQGAVAACVAAFLSAFTEPIVNRLLVNRMTVAQAIASVKVEDCLKFFLTTFPTNMLKFPIFEMINTALGFTSLSGGTRGMVNGWLFCSLSLPITNYRYRKSVGLPIEPALLYQAYPPTVLRDIVYGLARGYGGGLLVHLAPELAKGFVGKAFLFGATVWVACIVSSPFNEWRGFWLQNPAKKLPFLEFFQPAKYARSTGVGATIMGVSLMVGNLLVPSAERLFEYFKEHKPIGALFFIALVYLYSKIGSK